MSPQYAKSKLQVINTKRQINTWKTAIQNVTSRRHKDIHSSNEVHLEVVHTAWAFTKARLKRTSKNTSRTKAKSAET